MPLKVNCKLLVSEDQTRIDAGSKVCSRHRYRLNTHRMSDDMKATDVVNSEGTGENGEIDGSVIFTMRAQYCWMHGTGTHTHKEAD